MPSGLNAMWNYEIHTSLIGYLITAWIIAHICDFVDNEIRRNTMSILVDVMSTIDESRNDILCAIICSLLMIHLHGVHLP